MLFHIKDQSPGQCSTQCQILHLAPPLRSLWYWVTWFQSLAVLILDSEGKSGHMAHFDGRDVIAPGPLELSWCGLLTWPMFHWSSFLDLSALAEGQTIVWPECQQEKGGWGVILWWSKNGPMPGIMIPTSNPRTWKTEVGELWVWVQPEIHDKFHASLGYKMGPVSKDNEQ